MTAIEDLYQEVILHHSKSPRNFGVLEDADASADGYNPLCGDRIRVTVEREGDRVREVRFQGEGCAISKASASLMTDAVRGRTLEEIQALLDGFHALVTGEARANREPVALGKLEVFSGVKEFPVRVKCAMLAWRTLEAALANEPETVTTE